MAIEGDDSLVLSLAVDGDPDGELVADVGALVEAQRLAPVGRPGAGEDVTDDGREERADPHARRDGFRWGGQVGRVVVAGGVDEDDDVVGSADAGQFADVTDGDLIPGVVHPAHRGVLLRVTMEIFPLMFMIIRIPSLR